MLRKQLANRTCLLSQLENTRMEHQDCQQRQVTTEGLHQSLQATEGHYKALVAHLQQSLESSETYAQRLQQLLTAYEESAEMLRRNLSPSQQQQQQQEDEKNHCPRKEMCLSEDDLKVLKQELSGYEGHMLTLRQAFMASEDTVQVLHKNLVGSDELGHSLQQKRLVSEQKAQAAQEASEPWEGRARSTEAQRQVQSMEPESDQEQKLKKVMRAFKSSLEKLEAQLQETQKDLEETKERERVLHDTLATEKAQYEIEVQRVREDLEKSREEKIVMEQALRGQMIGVKNQLAEELHRANKKLEGSTQLEKKLQDTIAELRHALRSQKEGRALAVDCLKRRQQDAASMQRLIAVNIKYCSDAPDNQEANPGHAQAPASPMPPGNLVQPKELWQDLQEVKHQMNSALEKEEPKQQETQGRAQWEEVLRRAEQWQAEAERLVTSLESVKVNSTAEGKQPGANERTGALLSPANMGPATRPLSGDMALQRSTGEGGNYFNGTETASLAAAQRRLRNIKSVHFQKSLKEFLRMP